MRTSDSSPHSNASVTSPLVYQDEVNEEYHLHGNGNGESDDTDDNVVDPDLVEWEGESAGVKCILCNRFSYSCSGGNSRVLVCSEIGCPIALHELCMNFKPYFDDTGKFYCAYCWYKREVARAEELRRKFLLAKIKLLKFIRFKRDGGNEDGSDNMKANSLPTTAAGKNSGDCENGVNETIYYDQEQTVCVVSHGKEKSDDESSDNVADGQILQDEDIENTCDSENEGSDEDPCRVSEDNKAKSGEEEPVLPNAATLVSSPKIPSFEPRTSAEDKKTLSNVES
ncbi:hypothetical protein HRI_000300000 [Hibiscus trionum]|uniref:Zinc finger PHD-type domain-containing protein n=1 Tax=Hibiscus trionum TaxID=183268 RepID=A0A9W7GVD8_HIBTR|nr:hypothetical protein HRI_000300000 [Hibiscus trionum]